MPLPLPEPEQRMNCVYRLDKNGDWIIVTKVRWDILDFEIDKVVEYSITESKLLFPETHAIYATVALDKIVEECRDCSSPCPDKNKPVTLYRLINQTPALNS